ncbi:ammonium transporter [Minwuia thermotolerans]|uniref:Ammonium transporter n=1 Tax=Minwuia thermotolerans TaxID=2056226 RepID=A0A2M9G002_9PROT|nr:ammonium transporter [Minwuia thermotolerans]PJK29042.1 ammonium transporter [Minwuia thermotolerans]
MNLSKRILVGGPVAAALALGAAAPAFAQVSGETAFVFNTLSFLMCGFLVMFMAAGFAMLESGMVRSKNVATICVKNISLYSIAGIMYYLIGYDLMYGIDAGGYIGSFSLFWSPDDTAALADAFPTEDAPGYAATSDWFFQMVFVATAASIVSGTVAERVKLWPFLIFVVFLTAVIYPIQGSWEWGAGWLDAEFGFSDFAGSTLVHSTGGWAALMGAIIIGARRGKYGADGRVNPMPGSSMPLATLGTFILWLGWFGFNGGSQLALGSAADAVAIADIFANTNAAAAGGVIAAMLASQVVFKKVDLTMALNGAIGGLVSITAEPLAPTLGGSILIGGVGGVLVVLAVPLLDKLKIDDVVGAIPAHLVCGIWGTLVVPVSNSDASFGGQIVGIIAIGLFVSIASAIVWFALKATIGVRADEEDEDMGLDRAELGMEAYPEFGAGSQRI